MKDLKIAIASDHAGFDLKEKIVEYLKSNNYSSKDFGTFTKDSCDYPTLAKKVANEVSKGMYDRGILICGTGIGMSITANKVKRVRAALCWNTETAELSRQHNNSNVLCLGARMLDEALAVEIITAWLKTEFEGGRHQKRIDKIEE